MHNCQHKHNILIKSIISRAVDNIHNTIGKTSPSEVSVHNVVVEKNPVLTAATLAQLR